MKVFRDALLWTAAVSLPLGAAISSPTVPIAPGVSMPVVNLGGVESSPGNYSLFMDIGGRGLDTALSYGTDIQTAVGEAVASTSVPRDEIFVTTKVMCCPNYFTYQCEEPGLANLTTAQQVERDLKELGMDQVDLILLHWPCNTAEETSRTYAELEEALAQGKTRAIGVSNFNTTNYEDLSKTAKVKPAVNQCAMSVGLHDDRAIAYSLEHNITYQAYSPLGGISHVDVLNDPDVKRIAGLHNVSAAQVALRYVIQRNATFVTAGTNEEYLEEDLDVFNFELSEDEMNTLSAK